MFAQGAESGDQGVDLQSREADVPKKVPRKYENDQKLVRKLPAEAGNFGSRKMDRIIP